MEPSAQPAGTWGPLAVLPPQDGMDTLRLEGTLSITETCVYLESADEIVLLVWHADQVTWSAQPRVITFQNFDGRVVILSDGDRVVIGGSGGGEESGESGGAFVNRMTWVAAPAAS